MDHQVWKWLRDLTGVWEMCYNSQRVTVLKTASALGADFTGGLILVTDAAWIGYSTLQHQSHTSYNVTPGVQEARLGGSGLRRKPLQGFGNSLGRLKKLASTFF